MARDWLRITVPAPAQRAVRENEDPALLGSALRPSAASDGLAGTLGERWQLLGLRGENMGSADRRGAWSAEARERALRCRGGRDGRAALLLGLWFFFRDRLGGVNRRKRARRGGEIQTRAAGLRFRVQLDHVPRDG